ncbi:MAG: type II toxin-antitoxin system VapC family toxin [Candidatus Aminicenantes bacterium]|nr:type II toxin-antitoxin system VapC family toxin [Candidatus Aminicenantes bacterium]
MKSKKYLLDTHALVFWVAKEKVSTDFVAFFDNQGKKGNVYFSSASIWEIALLARKGRIKIKDVHSWKTDLLNNSPARMIAPTAEDMIDSTLLPGFHKDPFDRLLIAQAKNISAVLVTRDQDIRRYDIDTFWK